MSNFEQILQQVYDDTDPEAPALRTTGGGGGGGDATAANQVTGNASLSSIDSKMSDLKTYTDGLEALLAAGNGYTDGLEALITSLNGYVDGIEGYTDGIETLITSTNTKLDTLHTDIATTLAGYVDGLETLETAISGKLPATLVGGRLDVVVGAALPAGTALLGKAGIDQTTPGTTNAVQSPAGNAWIVRSLETTTPLAGNATYTGTAVDLGDPATASSYQGFLNTSYSDVAGAAPGLFLQGSADNSTWYTLGQATPVAGTPATPVNFTNAPCYLTRYPRSKYTNGAGAQSTFALFNCKIRGIFAI